MALSTEEYIAQLGQTHGLTNTQAKKLYNINILLRGHNASHLPQELRSRLDAAGSPGIEGLLAIVAQWLKEQDAMPLKLQKDDVIERTQVPATESSDPWMQRNMGAQFRVLAIGNGYIRALGVKGVRLDAADRTWNIPNFMLTTRLFRIVTPQ